jgi:hypothetical protein
VPACRGEQADIEIKEGGREGEREREREGEIETWWF